MAVATLSAAGIDTVGFEDPIAAWEAIEITSLVRVLVTRVDFGSGKLNGVALARMVRMKRPGAKVVFVALPSNAHHTEGAGTAEDAERQYHAEDTAQDPANETDSLGDTSTLADPGVMNELVDNQVA